MVNFFAEGALNLGDKRQDGHSGFKGCGAAVE